LERTKKDKGVRREKREKAADEGGRCKSNDRFRTTKSMLRKRGAVWEIAPPGTVIN